jgi:hypothetical protein
MHLPCRSTGEQRTNINDGRPAIALFSGGFGKIDIQVELRHGKGDRLLYRLSKEATLAV